jgi:hypothetical protein
MGTEEATRGDYEYNPPDRSVAKSAHSVLPSIGCRGMQRRTSIPYTLVVLFSGKRWVGQAEWKGERTTERGQGHRQETLERARKNIGSRV